MTNQSPTRARDKKIRTQRFQYGWTLKKVGLKHNLSNERIRQICSQKEEKVDIEKDIKNLYKKKFGKATLVDLMEDIKALRNYDRRKETVLRRKYLVRFLFDELDIPFYRIGDLMNRHHTSILNLYYSD